MKRLLLFALLLAFPLRADELVPLNDLGKGDYRWGYIGGLYDNGTNAMDADHLAAGMQFASRIQPLDINGHPSPTGKIVFLGAGFDETSRIMCGPNLTTDCNAGALMTMAATDARVNHDSLVILNGARDNFVPDSWEWPWRATYNYIKSDVLGPAGVSEQQVQAVWLEMATAYPQDPPLPIQYADAYRLKAYVAAALHVMKQRYPNLQIVYMSSRVYGGYSTSNWSPEPYAYENGLTVRWIVVGQQLMMRDPWPYWDTRIGDIRYDNGSAPWVAWGPYLWANGATPRSDGLTWQRSDFEANGETLTAGGAHKAASLLFDFLLHEPTAASWFLNPDAPRRTRVTQH